MRRYALFLALVATLGCFAGAKIEWDKTEHNFGAFSESMGPATAVFTFRNTGDRPLVITGARANCGCTTPTLSADVVQPGQQATLEVSYDPEGRPGRFEKKVYVDTNTDPKRSTLTIRGVSVGSSGTVASRYPVDAGGGLRLAHPAALLGKLNRGHVKSVFEPGYNASLDTLRPVVADAPSWLEVKPMPAAVPPGEQVSFNFFVNADKCPLWDLVTDTVTVRPYAGSADAFRMPVVVTVTEDFSTMTDRQLKDAPAASVTPARLNPVVLTANGATASFDIANTGKSPLKIRRIYTVTPGVTADVKAGQSVKGGKSQRVNVSIPADMPVAGMAASVVMVVITNDPFAPRSTVTIPIVKSNQ